MSTEKKRNSPFSSPFPVLIPYFLSFLVIVGIWVPPLSSLLFSSPPCPHHERREGRSQRGGGEKMETIQQRERERREQLTCMRMGGREERRPEKVSPSLAYIALHCCWAA